MNTPRLNQSDAAHADVLWMRGYDTYQISKRLDVSEAAVANTLSELRERRAARKRERVTA